MKGYLVGFRKWTMAIIFLIVAVSLLLLKEIPSKDWLSNVKDVMVAFMATNIGEHIINVGREWIKEKKWFGHEDKKL